MKKISLILILSLVTLLSAEAHKHRNTYVTISLQNFYDELSPYGDWVYTTDYGYVWRPYFDYPEAFRPYSSGGHWVNTEFGWTWVSDYTWGWATFHYGRWAYDDYLGWMWLPGTEWAPAWVTWGYYGNYYGWAPMGPNVYAFSNSNWYAPDPWWTFVPRIHFCSDNWNHYIYDRPVHVTNITYITNVYENHNQHNTGNSWYYGPRVSEVEKYSGKRVRQLQVVDSERHETAGVRNEQLRVYRPQVENRRSEYRPAEYRNMEQARAGNPIRQTNATANDPGNNRTRDIKSEARNITQLPAARNESINRGSRIEPARKGANTRNIDATDENRVTPRNTGNMEYHKGQENRNMQVEPRNSSRSIKEPGREPQVQRRNQSATENSRSTAGPARSENNGNPQTRAIRPAKENGNSASSREVQNRNNTSVAPTHEQKPASANPESNSRTVKDDRKQSTKQENRNAEKRK